MKELFNDILSTIKGMSNILPDMLVDSLDYYVDESSYNTKEYVIFSEFKISSKDGFCACVNVSVSNENSLSLCIINVDDSLAPMIEGDFRYPELLNYLVSSDKYPDYDSAGQDDYINKIVPIEQVKEAYVNLLKDIQAYITSFKS